MRIEDELKIALFEELKQLRVFEHGLEVLIVFRSVKLFALRILPSAPGRHDEDLIRGVIPADEIIETAQPRILDHAFRETKL